MQMQQSGSLVRSDKSGSRNIVVQTLKEGQQKMQEQKMKAQLVASRHSLNAPINLRLPLGHMHKHNESQGMFPIASSLQSSQAAQVSGIIHTARPSY